MARISTLRMEELASIKHLFAKYGQQLALFLHQLARRSDLIATYYFKDIYIYGTLEVYVFNNNNNTHTPSLSTHTSPPSLSLCVYVYTISMGVEIAGSIPSRFRPDA